MSDHVSSRALDVLLRCRSTDYELRTYMRELDIPTGVSSDPRATEMLRFWLAQNKPHVTLLLGMYEDAEDCDVDELFAWGQILGDIAQHVANGLQKSHGWDFDESAKAIVTHFVDAMRTRAPGLEGDFPGGASSA